MFEQNLYQPGSQEWATRAELEVLPRRTKDKIRKRLFYLKTAFATASDLIAKSGKGLRICAEIAGSGRRSSRTASILRT